MSLSINLLFVAFNSCGTQKTVLFSITRKLSWGMDIESQWRNVKNSKNRKFCYRDYQEIDFAPGFNVVTGETGAGKSLLINAFLFF